jgi:hypothetical protein
LEQAETAAENAPELFKEGSRYGLIGLRGSVASPCQSFSYFWYSIRVLVWGRWMAPRQVTPIYGSRVRQFTCCLVFFARKGFHMQRKLLRVSKDRKRIEGRSGSLIDPQRRGDEP